MKSLKEIGQILALAGLPIFVSCGDVVFAEDVEPSTQLADDIAVIEDYLDKEGYTDYDTLDSEVRVVILEEGTGDVINYNDLIWYDYIGSFIDSLIFDTSISSIALEQDMKYALDSTFLKSLINPELDSLDDQGERILLEVSFQQGYFHIYNENPPSFYTTHTPGGWFIKQSQLISGFKDGIHHVFENVNISGRGLVLIPSDQAYGRGGTIRISPNTPIMFEIRTIRKK